MKTHRDFLKLQEIRNNFVFEDNKKQVNPFKNPIDPSELTCCVILTSLFRGEITTNPKNINEIFNFLKSSTYINNFDLIGSHSSIKGKINEIKDGLDIYFKDKVETIGDVHSKIWDGISQAYLIYNETSGNVKNNFSKVYWNTNKFPEQYEFLSSYIFDEVVHDNTSDLLLEVKNTDDGNRKFDIFGISLKIGNSTLKNTSLSKLGKTFREQKSEVIYLEDDSDNLHPFIKEIRKGMYEFYNNVFSIYLSENREKLTNSYNHTLQNKKLSSPIRKNLNGIMSNLFTNFKPDEILDEVLVSKTALSGEDWLNITSTTFEVNILDNLISGTKTRIKDEFRDFINEQLKMSKTNNKSFLKKLEDLPNQSGFNSHFLNYLLETAYKFNIDKELKNNTKKIESSNNINHFLYFLCANKKVNNGLDNLGEGKFQNIDSIRDELTVLLTLLEEERLVLIPRETNDSTVTVFFYLCKEGEKNPEKNGFLKLEFRYKGKYTDLNLQVYFNSYLKTQIEKIKDEKEEKVIN